MLSYVYLGTNDLERATHFYDATLADAWNATLRHRRPGVGSGIG
jgi:hypothetical protein